ncbi:MAG TPA: hypothetical protein VKK79_25050 [Candidatus Lokiarchaeia archaeon]|nr:hypothetical protein [Candidatus Lokiarchaeia archaeon]
MRKEIPEQKLFPGVSLLKIATQSWLGIYGEELSTFLAREMRKQNPPDFLEVLKGMCKCNWNTFTVLCMTFEITISTTHIRNTLPDRA